MDSGFSYLTPLLKLDLRIRVCGQTWKMRTNALRPQASSTSMVRSGCLCLPLESISSLLSPGCFFFMIRLLAGVLGRWFFPLFTSILDEHQPLLYEFMRKGSFENHLVTNDVQLKSLLWTLCVNVPLDAAKV
ncbi:hypothetical protein HA466_0208610 [Hirschfeldia incana]|nr:hypothetical protein HA466_0208610 [Hirschfeldia incana]